MRSASTPVGWSALRPPRWFSGLPSTSSSPPAYDLRQLIIGHGDHWIAGGALAICALAAGRVTQAAAALGRLLASLQQILSISTLALWCLAMVWLFPLIICETLKPPLRYDTRRWATVFPLGIYAAASIETGQVRSITWITNFGHAWTWVGFAAWLLALAGLLYQGPARAAW